MEFLGGLWDGMNDQEVIMFDAKPKQDFIAHRKAIEAAGIAIRLVEKLPRRFDSLADQVIREIRVPFCDGSDDSTCDGRYVGSPSINPKAPRGRREC
jgi:hypothetical protein